VAISRKKNGDKKATKSVILGTISYTFKFATVWNLAPQKITYTVLQQSGYKYVFLATNMFFDLVVAINEVLSFSMLKIEL
jgi:hypothetical protein